MQTIPEAEAFNAASAALATHNEKTRELSLDQAIAKRGGDEDDIAKADAAYAEFRKGWHPLYLAETRAAHALSAVLGVDHRKLAGALQRELR